MPLFPCSDYSVVRFGGGCSSISDKASLLSSMPRSRRIANGGHWTRSVRMEWFCTAPQRLHSWFGLSEIGVETW